MKLTDLALKVLSAEAGQRTFFDDNLPGFGIRVSPKSKTFVLVSGTPRRWETLGRYPLVTLSKAREKAKNIMAARQLGEEPLIDLTFSAAFEEYRTTHLPRIRPPTAYEQARILRVRFEPRLGRRKLGDLTARDVAPIIDAIPTVYSARAAFVAARIFFNWCARRDYLIKSPISRLTPPRRPEPRDRVLTDAEIVAVWQNAPKDVFGAIVRLLILTGQRRAQISDLKTAFVHDEMITWPPGRMKGNRRHSIPLTPMTAAILAEYPEGIPTFQQWSPAKLKLNKACGFSDWVLHDLRRTMATKLAELGTAPHIIERILAHHSGVISGVSAIYNRFSYLEEMRSAMKEWETTLQALLSTSEGTNV